MLHVAYEQLAADPAATPRRITDWLAIPPAPPLPPPRTPPPARPAGPCDPLIDELHARLAERQRRSSDEGWAHALLLSSRQRLY